jgi:16S rRNA (uracil1498-N3)-methyltransferase
MRPRFLVPDLDAQRPEVALPPEEAHHLSRVLRIGVGGEIAVFDGRGREFRARVASIGRNAVTVTLLDPVAPPAMPGVALTLVQSVLKSDAMDGVVRDCTMVGVESIQPVVSERTTVKTSLLLKGAERWRRVALAAAKQSGRARLPRILEAVSFERWTGQRDHGSAFILVEPGLAAPDTVGIRDLAHRPAPARASLVVGPEGGWTPEERDLAVAAGCAPLSLGRLTLRADAVPLAATAALLAIWDE